jgi:hypothetical protein
MLIYCCIKILEQYEENDAKRTNMQKGNLSRPGIEPGSVQPQCTILTTVRSRPIETIDITVHILYSRYFEGICPHYSHQVLQATFF